MTVIEVKWNIFILFFANIFYFDTFIIFDINLYMTKKGHKNGTYLNINLIFMLFSNVYFVNSIQLFN